MTVHMEVHPRKFASDQLTHSDEDSMAENAGPADLYDAASLHPHRVEAGRVLC